MQGPAYFNRLWSYLHFQEVYIYYLTILVDEVLLTRVNIIYV